MKLFESNGTSTPGQWHMATVEWLLVHLLTEVGVTPHNFSTGRNMGAMMEAYQDILREFKQRVFDPWKRGETVTLTRKFLQSIEEVETISKILNKKYDFFQRLKADCEIFEEQDKENNVAPNNPDGKTSVERASWAVDMIREQLNESSFVLKELTRSMNVLIHIRTIEQNELSIVRDGQERAIRLFTGVTIVFLILSFCTSYFGMQLEGIVGTQRTEAYFWYVCGTSTLTILLLFTLYTFRSQLREHFRKRNRRIQLDL
jgi:Mg2+ and Co2+ transporter CorA